MRQRRIQKGKHGRKIEIWIGRKIRKAVYVFNLIHLGKYVIGIYTKWRYIRIRDISGLEVGGVHVYITRGGGGVKID